MSFVRDAIAREKEIKGWRRIKKIQLIVSMNPTWKDLSLELWPELEAEMRQIRKVLEEEKGRKQASKLAQDDRRRGGIVCKYIDPSLRAIATSR